MRLRSSFSGLGLGLGLALALGLGGSQAASALSLADLAGGANVVSSDGGFTFDDFVVNLKGGSLADFEVNAEDGGFSIDLSSASKAKIKLSYTVATPGQMVGTSLTLNGSGKSKAGEKLSNGSTVAQLKVKAGESESESLNLLQGLSVQEQIKIKDGNVASILHQYDLSAPIPSGGAVPEPSSLLLLAAPVAVLAARRARRRRTA